MRTPALALATALTVATLPAQIERIRASITRAERAAEAGKGQLATALLHRAARAVPTIDDPRTRKRLDRELRSLARKADPDAAALAAATEDAVDKLLDAARRCARKKWHRAALRLAEAAATWDGDAARKALAGYRRKVDKLPALAEDIAAVMGQVGDTGVFRMVSSAEDAIDDRRPADAALLIVAARTTLPTVRKARRRTELAGEIAAQAARLGRPGPEVLAAMRAAAAPLHACAARYAERGWHRVALSIAERAAVLDAPALTEIIAASRAALDTDYVGALDVLYEVFQISENVTNEGTWRILPDRVISPALTDSRDILLVAKETLGPDARIALRAAPTRDSPVKFGLIFGYRSRDDYLLLEVNQTDGATFLQILRWHGGAYRKVAYGERDLVGWRGEPVEIALEMVGGRVVARLGDAEPLTGSVEAPMTSGRIGLFVPEPACKAGGVTFVDLFIEKM